MSYLILSQANEAYAQGLSKKLYHLTRPTTDPGDVTIYYNSWIVHPTDGRVALVFPDADIQPIHDLADPEIVVTHIESVLSEADKTELRNNVGNAKGKRVQPANLLPQKFVSLLKTHDEMEADGWFPVEAI